ncbi:MAG: hypothetical protein KGH79_00840 [Patescibacteria group bacterium]|nr:hypothetical protein [Patescibacteria group bacterium]
MSNVLFAEKSTSVRFASLDEVEKAIKIFAADPVIDMVLLGDAELLWDLSGYELRVPARADGRIELLLDRYEVPFVLQSAD